MRPPVLWRVTVRAVSPNGCAAHRHPCPPNPQPRPPPPCHPGRGARRTMHLPCTCHAPTLHPPAPAMRTMHRPRAHQPRAPVSRRQALRANPNPNPNPNQVLRAVRQPLRSALLRRRQPHLRSRSVGRQVDIHPLGPSSVGRQVDIHPLRPSSVGRQVDIHPLRPSSAQLTSEPEPQPRPDGTCEVELADSWHLVHGGVWR